MTATLALSGTNNAGAPPNIDSARVWAASRRIDRMSFTSVRLVCFRLGITPPIATMRSNNARAAHHKA
ncbi:hypothetical protein Sbs19_37070 [Sphingobium sp. BS19]|nr:hypothetical protein Sbs19_37070 [Sphingobium sp. BS19]